MILWEKIIAQQRLEYCRQMASAETKRGAKCEKLPFEQKPIVARFSADTASVVWLGFWRLRDKLRVAR